MRLRVIIQQFEIVKNEAENIFFVGVNPQTRQGTGGACKLQTGLFQSVQIEVRITQRVDEIAGFKSQTCASISVSSA